MPSLSELAENFTLYMPPRPGFFREIRDEWALTTGLSGANVLRVRLAEGAVAAAVDEIRHILREQDVDRITWWCGESATPSDLPEQLTALGLVPDEEARTLATMALEAPPAGTPAAEVRRVATFEEFRTAQEIDWTGWGLDEALRAKRRAHAEEIWASTQGQRALLYLGYLDGEPVGYARAFLLEEAMLLLGGATLPSVRGRGVYLSLVHARWRDAVAHGTPRLIVQAGPMSQPILERVGFRVMGQIRLLVDKL